MGYREERARSWNEIHRHLVGGMDEDLQRFDVIQ